LSGKFRRLYEDDVTSYKKMHGDFILVNTNFGLGNNVKGDVFVERNYGSRFPQLKKNNGVSEAAARAIYRAM